MFRLQNAVQQIFVFQYFKQVIDCLLVRIVIYSPQTEHQLDWIVAEMVEGNWVVQQHKAHTDLMYIPTGSGVGQCDVGGHHHVGGIGHGVFNHRPDIIWFNGAVPDQQLTAQGDGLAEVRGVSMKDNSFFGDQRSKRVMPCGL